LRINIRIKRGGAFPFSPRPEANFFLYLLLLHFAKQKQGTKKKEGYFYYYKYKNKKGAGLFFLITKKIRQTKISFKARDKIRIKASKR
jgi:hypothetical protein